MKISLNWLKAYIKTNLNAEQISRTLTQIGLEVEGFEKAESIRGGLAGLVVGEVLTCDKHPDADKLHVTTVDLGDGQPTQIVCGAPNVAAGQKVVVATINAMLYPTGEENGFKIKKVKSAASNRSVCCAPKTRSAWERATKESSYCRPT